VALLLRDLISTSAGHRQPTYDLCTTTAFSQQLRNVRVGLAKLVPVHATCFSPIMPTDLQLWPLLLAGGRSTRMGRAKHLLQMPDGRPLYQHQLDLLRAACPEAPVLYVSLARDSLTDPLLRSGDVSAGTPGCKLEIIYDLQDNSEADISAGPAAGLLAAHHAHPDSTWLVLACDYPLMTSDALVRLRSSYQAPVTCFRNAEGFCEPLVAVWSPVALARLAANHAKVQSGPQSVVRDLGGLMLMPETTMAQSGARDAMVLWNVNTEAEWQIALETLRKSLDGRRSPGGAT